MNALHSLCRALATFVIGKQACSIPIIDRKLQTI